MATRVKTLFKAAKARLRGVRRNCAGCRGGSLVCDGSAWAALDRPSLDEPLWPARRSAREWSSTPDILRRLSGAILQTQPLRIVETGTFEGLGTTALGLAAPHEAAVMTFDLDDPEASAPRRANLDALRQARPDLAVDLTLGDTRETLAGRAEALAGWAFWYQDSAHDIDGIAAEWAVLASLAGPGALVVFDDVDHRHPWGKRFAAEIAPGAWCWRTWICGTRRQLWAQRVE